VNRFCMRHLTGRRWNTAVASIRCRELSCFPDATDRAPTSSRRSCRSANCTQFQADRMPIISRIERVTGPNVSRGRGGARSQTRKPQCKRLFRSADAAAQCPRVGSLAGDRTVTALAPAVPRRRAGAYSRSPAAVAVTSGLADSARFGVVASALAAATRPALGRCDSRCPDFAR
jgi:hypothetical protein